jgi:hypothetical protein
LTRAEREVKIYTDDKKALMKLVVATSDKTSAVVELGVGNSSKSLER